MGPCRTGQQLHLPLALRHELLRHAVESSPRECCGLVVGDAVRDATTGVTHLHVEQLIPLPNETDAPNCYLLGAGLIAPLRELRQTGKQLLAIYHSHPQGPALPSRHDVQDWTYPEAVQLIVAPRQIPSLRGYLIGRGAEQGGTEPAIHEVPILIG